MNQSIGPAEERPSTTSRSRPALTSTMPVNHSCVRNGPRLTASVSSIPTASGVPIRSTSASKSAWPQLHARRISFHRGSPRSDGVRHPQICRAPVPRPRTLTPTRPRLFPMRQLTASSNRSRDASNRTPEPQTLAHPDRAGQRDLRRPLDLPQPPTPTRYRNAHTNRI